MKHQEKNKEAACSAHHLAVRDTMDLRIIASLSLGKKRFMELKSKIDGIAAKMLSKELQELEMNGLVTRKVMETKPITVEYELTDYGHTLGPVIEELAKWGVKHREIIIGERKKSNQD